MPVPIHGVQYQTVNERLEVAHDESGRPTGIQSIQTEWLERANRVIAVATIMFKDGRVFQGTSEVPFNSTSPAEKGAPFECAETSAWGRALAAAGYYGSDKGIAGAEELALSVERAAFRDAGVGQQRALPSSNASAQGRPTVVNKQEPATPKQIELLERILPDTAYSEVDFDTLTRGRASELIDQYGNKR